MLCMGKILTVDGTQITCRLRRGEMGSQLRVRRRLLLLFSVKYGLVFCVLALLEAGGLVGPRVGVVAEWAGE